MTLYRHYKSKLYRFHGFVTHSETLEELVSYECLYENPLSKHWVRPKEMFFGEVEHQGQTCARFQPVDWSIEVHDNLSAEERDDILRLGSKIFPSWNAEKVRHDWMQKGPYQLRLAKLDKETVGFHLAYPLSPDIFYSWLGGVLPAYRRLGVAGALRDAQQRWCQAHAYKKILTKTLATNSPMLLLNLKQGFTIVGSEDSDYGLRLILEKPLP